MQGQYKKKKKKIEHVDSASLNIFSYWLVSYWLVESGRN